MTRRPSLDGFYGPVHRGRQEDPLRTDGDHDARCWLWRFEGASRDSGNLPRTGDRYRTFEQMSRMFETFSGWVWPRPHLVVGRNDGCTGVRNTAST